MAKAHDFSQSGGAGEIENDSPVPIRRYSVGMETRSWDRIQDFNFAARTAYVDVRATGGPLSSALPYLFSQRGQFGSVVG